jgi:hypothetical protein
MNESRPPVLVTGTELVCFLVRVSFLLTLLGGCEQFESVRGHGFCGGERLKTTAVTVSETIRVHLVLPHVALLSGTMVDISPVTLGVYFMPDCVPRPSPPA